MPTGQADTIFIPACVIFVSKYGYSTEELKYSRRPTEVCWGHAELPWQAALRSTHAGQREELGSQLGRNPQSPGSPLSWATSLALNFRTLKVKMTSSFLPELCLHRRDVGIMDVKGRPYNCLLCPLEKDPPHPFHSPSQALGPSSGQERGEAMKEEDHAFHFLPMSLSSIHPKY